MSQPSAKDDAGACTCRGLRRRNGGGPRHWFRITGLSGRERAGLGLPAFGDPQCIRQHRPGFLRRLMSAMRRWFGHTTTTSMDPFGYPAAYACRARTGHAIQKNHKDIMGLIYEDRHSR